MGPYAVVATGLLTPTPTAVSNLTTAEHPFEDRTRPASPAPGGPAGPLAVGESFGRRYQILRVLGVGGMGAVYHAWDAELGMAIALKVIRPEATRDPFAARDMEQRFKQELVLARQITHKNVVRIHDLGEIGGIKYITMPYLEGSDLATVLTQHGRVAIPLALRIARDVASGLVAAHEAGIVHRDLKPANVMILEDHAVIMDFGIASSSARVVGTLAAAETVRGHELAGLLSRAPVSARAGHDDGVVGTVPYMAPEQARGEPADQRADIYALGLILYDMVGGGRDVVHGLATVVGDLHARTDAPPPPLRSSDTAFPEALDALMQRCLQPDPARRFQTSAELVAALDRLDENGVALRVRPKVGLGVIAAIVAAAVTVGTAGWWYAREPGVVVRDPVSVLIADLQNGTGDAAFTQTLEPMLKIALEDATFITAFDRSQVGRSLGVPPPDALTETAAREIAVKQGLGVVLAASLTTEDGGYRLALKAVRAVTGDEIAAVAGTARGKSDVLALATTLAADLRGGLGDDTSDEARRFAMETLSATSLDVVREYAAAINANSTNRFDDARQRFAKAIALDPQFGLAHAGMAMALRNLGREQEARTAVQEAVRHLERMTERERFRTRGLFYTITGDYDACVKEYTDLIARYSADPTAHNNLALCSTYLRRLGPAVAGMRRVVDILPNRALYRVNLALYAAYGGDFETGLREARTAQELGSSLGLLPLAFAHLAQGNRRDAAAAYDAMGASGPQGASFAASGLADLAAYEGRYGDAVRLLERAAAADVKAGALDRAAAKDTAIAHAHLLAGEPTAAVAAATRALGRSQSVRTRFLAARLFADVGDADRARPLAEALEGELRTESRAYGRIVSGLLALQRGDSRGAVGAISESIGILDTWIGRFDLARAYLAAGAFTQADSELDRSLARRGEALALFLDEEPTFSYLPAVYYYQGRAREGLGSSGFAASYRTYLTLRAAADEDPLLPEIRRRAGE